MRAEKNEPTDPVVIIKPVIAELDFPAFPDPLSDSGDMIVSFDPATKSVVMPLWYWQQITLYVVKVDEVQSVYEIYRSRFR